MVVKIAVDLKKEIKTHRIIFLLLIIIIEVFKKTTYELLMRTIETW